MSSNEYRRAAFIKKSECKPKKCRQECKKSCPVNKMKKKCIVVKPTSKIAFISEALCVGCGICVKKCPFGAIQILNLPKNLDRHTVHRYGPNSFKLHRLPSPRPGKILGLVGKNGIGKSTALKILAGFKPNLGHFEEPPDWQSILKYFRGSELQSYFTKILEDNLKTVSKPQYVDVLSKKMKGKVRRALKRGSTDEGKFETVVRDLELEQLLDRNISDLSGGETQRMAIAMVCLQQADVYIFDEPSSYLDVRQRLIAARVIRSLMEDERQGGSPYGIVVEHDLSILDYLSDYICVLYGTPGAYGVVTLPFSVREGINHFLEGYIPTENLRFRDSKLSFKFHEGIGPVINADNDSVPNVFRYPLMTRTQGSFKLKVSEGSFSESEIIVMLGQNGTGKSTFVKILAGIIPPDNAEDLELPEFRVSYKPQSISTEHNGTVRSLIHKKIQNTYTSPSFVAEVIKPLEIDEIIDREFSTLSGGEQQRVALTLCLGKKATLYLIDEPSAYLDSEQRIVASKVIKRFILSSKKTAFVVEHDFIMSTYLADKVIVYEGVPAVKCTALSPKSLFEGMNCFLKSLNITFRRDPANFRPRINKLNSQKDQEQKHSGNFFAADGKGKIPAEKN